MFFSMFVISRKRFAKCWFFSVLGFFLVFLCYILFSVPCFLVHRRLVCPALLTECGTRKVLPQKIKSPAADHLPPGYCHYAVSSSFYICWLPKSAMVLLSFLIGPSDWLPLIKSASFNLPISFSGQPTLIGLNNEKEWSTPCWKWSRRRCTFSERSPSMRQWSFTNLCRKLSRRDK